MSFKKIILPMIACLFVGCSDSDTVVETTIPMKGEAIPFAAQSDVKTVRGKDARLTWGDVKGEKIELNWTKGDLLSIGCNQASPKVATYRIQENGVDRSSLEFAADVVGNSDRPLNWGDVSQLHRFVSYYPSKFAFGEEEIARGYVGLSTEGLRGILPTNQTNRNAKETEKVLTIANPDHKGSQLHIVKPDMRFALMVADETIDPQVKKGPITLTYKTIVTALEFDITANTISNQIPGQSMEIMGATLASDRYDLCGDFAYRFDDDQYVNLNDEKGDHREVTVQVPTGTISLKKNDACRMTFFIASNLALDKQEAAKHLFLRIMYRIDGRVQSKVANLNVDIQPRYKHYFRNLVMPPITEHQIGSTWMSALDPNVLVNQLSIPAAGNAFSNYSNMEKNGVHYAREQVMDYEQLWNIGIRAFEFVNTIEPGNKHLGESHFVCGEEALTSDKTGGQNITLNSAFDNLVQFIVDKKTYPQYQGESLFLIMRYHAVDFGNQTKYDPQAYLDQLAGFLDSRVGKAYGPGQVVLTPEHFVLANPSTQLKDIRGKIVILVRPGDDAYMQWTLGKTTNDLTLPKWDQHVVVIKDWGSAYDCWDRRYPNPVAGLTKPAREATWDANNKLTHVEDYLYGISVSSETGPSNPLKKYEVAFKQWPFVFQASKVDYLHGVVGHPEAQVHVQEWARVVPRQWDMTPHYPSQNADPNELNRFGLGRDGYAYLWVKWPESMTEKEEALLQTIYSSTSTAGKKSNTLFINVLSGYYMTPKWANSAEPFINSVAVPGGGVLGSTGYLVPQHQGNGGNYAALAADLNTYLCSVLENPLYPVGPLGIVMMDYIGATADQFTQYCAGESVTSAVDAAIATGKLPDLIMMNNFKFPMEKGETSGETPQLEFDFGYTSDEVIAD